MAICPSAVFNKGSPYYDEAPLLAGQGFKVCEAAFEYILKGAVHLTIGISML